METFVRHWWIAKYNDTSEENVYKHFKKRWNSGEIEPEKFLDELVKDAALYVKISSPVTEDFKQQEEKSLYRSLTALRIFNLSSYKPFVLNLFKAKEKKNLTFGDVKNVLFFIEKFHFSFNAICSMRPSGIDGTYGTGARNLFAATDKNSARQVIEALKEKLNGRLPKKETFKSKFSELKFLNSNNKDKKVIQYIFTYLESVKQTTDEFKPDNITLEHILPQSSGKETFVAAIGNLLPLGQTLNQKAGNKSLSDKIKVYEKSNFAVTQEFAKSNPEKWGKTEIRARTNALAEECYNSMWG